MKKVLVLSDTYLPLNVASVHETFKKLSNDKVEVVDYYDEEVMSGKHSFKIPAVIKLKSTPNMNRSRRIYKPFSKRNVWIRDDMQCQYCSLPVSMSQNHWDHVVPRSKGGKTSWTNVVTCCKKCNSYKSNKSLNECGFKLSNKPVAPYSSSTLYDAVQDTLKKHISKIPHESWKKFLYWSPEDY